MRAGLPLLALLLLLARAAPAHELRPAYLELRQSAPDTIELLWRVPARSDGRSLALAVELPPDAADLTAPRGERFGASFVERRSVRRTGGWEGATIRVVGLEATLTDALVRHERLDGTSQLARLTPASPAFVVAAAAPGPAQLALAYAALGVEHILLGADHLLFVLALVLLVDGRRRLVATITAFTAAHSVTLAAATLGLVAVPAAPVEACIALSIVFLGAEIVHARRGRPGLAARRPWIVAFGFGLLHGFGFAGALREVGLPPGDVPLALLFFNLGVELGQLAFVAAALAAGAAARRIRSPLTAWTGRLAPYAIGGVASFWLLERLAVLGS